MKANAQTKRPAGWLTVTTAVVAACSVTMGQAASCQTDPLGPEVVIIRQPANRTVQASQTVTFSVLAAGISPDSGSEVFYHWHKDGVPLANGNAYRNGWNNGGTAME